VEITFVPAPTVTLADFNPINPNATPIQLTGGVPTGGTYSGPGVSNGVFTPSVAGIGTHIITYTYVSPEGCSGTASKTIEVTNAVGVSANTKITAFSVTPNPSKGLVSLSIAGISNGDLKVQVIDQLGRIVWTKTYNDNSSQLKKELDLSALPKGSYFIKANLGEASEVQKLILE
jgi:hypothetical protein